MTSLTAALVGIMLAQIGEPGAQPGDAGSAGSDPTASAEADAGAPTAAEPAAGPGAPGEPVPDRSLSPGTLAVVLKDAAGNPLSGATIFVETAGEPGAGRRLTAKTDSRGEIRVADVPLGDSEAIVVGHETATGVLTSTAPFAMPPDTGVRVMLAVPGRTDDPGAVTLEHLHVVLEREGSRIRVTETLSLATAGGAIFANRSGIAVPRPRGGVGLRFADAEEAASQAVIDDEGVLVTAPIPPSGLEVSVVFDIPIESGSTAFEQEIPLPTTAAQVLSTWTEDGARLTVDGFSPAERAELMNGLTALVTAADGLEDGRLKVRLEGIADGPAAVRRAVALVASAIALALGLALWIRRRLRRQENGGNGG